jgi:hypothetical protein
MVTIKKIINKVKNSLFLHELSLFWRVCSVIGKESKVGGMQFNPSLLEGLKLKAVFAFSARLK